MRFVRNRFLRMTFTIYMVLIGGLFLSFYAVSYAQRENALEEEARYEVQSRVEHMVQIMDEKFSAIDLLAEQINGSRWRSYVGSKSPILYSQVDYIQRMEVCREIRTFQALLGIAESIAVVFPEKNLVIDKEAFWEGGQYFKSLGLEEDWLEQYVWMRTEGYYGQELFTEGGEDGKERFIIVRQIASSGSERGLLFVLVDRRQFQKFIEMNLPDASSFTIYAGEKVIYASEQLNARSSMQEQMPSRLYRWEYCFDVRTDYEGGLGQEGGQILLILFGLLTVAAVVSYLLAKLTYWPLGQLLARIDGKQEKRYHGLEGLELMYQELKTGKEEMEELANQYLSMGRNHFLTNLLMGNYDKAQVTGHVREYGIDFVDGGIYAVVCYRMDLMEQAVLPDVMLELKLICIREGIEGALCSVGDEQVMILCASDGKLLSDRMEEFHEVLDEKYPETDIELYTGRPHAGFRGICQSYQEARDKQLRVRTKSEQLIYYYPMEMEERINNLMKNGSFNQVHDVLAQLERENAARDVLPEIEKKVIELIYERFLRFASGIGLELQTDCEWYTEFGEELDISGLWRMLDDLCSEIGKLYWEEQQFQSLGKSIVQYVEERYACSSLALQDIADCFGVSRPTVSRLFKETVNMKFLDYLHKKRVEHAKELFSQGKYDLSWVAKECGYENEVTFKRAFLKNEGVTPHEYAKRIQIYGTGQKSGE